MVKDEESNKVFRQILENYEDTFEYDGKTIRVRLPTIKEKLSVASEVKEIEHYSDLDPIHQRVLKERLLALKMMIEPKFTTKQYINSPDGKLEYLLDTVTLWYGVTLKKIDKERESLVEHFLEQVKEK